MHLLAVARVRTACTLTYVVHGVAHREDPTTSIDLCEEIQEILSHPGPVSVAPTPGALEVRITVTDIEPFDRDDFEPHIYEQVLWHAVNACCHMEGDGFRFDLKSAEYMEATPNAHS